MSSPAALLAALRAAKAEGNELFRAGQATAARAAYERGLQLAADAQRADPHGELDYEAAAECVACYANVAASALREGTPAAAEAAAAAARAGLALSAAPEQPQLQAKLFARLAAAQTLAGDAPGAAATRALAARLGLRAVDGGRWGESRELDGSRILPTIIAGAIQCAAADDTTTVLAVVDASGLHVDARDGNGFNALWGACQALGRGAEAGLTDLAPARLIRALLERDAAANQTFEAGRTPLMYAANAGDAAPALAAAAVLLDAGAAINARDGRGWSSAMIVMAEGERYPGWRCAQMTELLLARGADARHRNHGGDSALAVLMLHASTDADATAEEGDLVRAARALLAAPGGTEVLAARNDIGYGPLTTALRIGPMHAVVGVLQEAYAAAGLADFAAEETAAVQLLALLNACVEADNIAAMLKLPDGPAGAERERRCLAALLQQAGLPGRSAAAACEAHPNPLLGLRDFIMARMPRACMTIYEADAPPAASSQEAGILRVLAMRRPARSGMPAPAADAADALPGLGPFTYDEEGDTFDEFFGAVARRPRRLTWDGLTSFAEAVLDPVRHAFSFSVPNDAALDALVKLSPLLEVGAGTGYWARLLRLRGADVLATDADPPDAATLRNGFHTAAVPGGDVVAQGGAEAAAAHPGRALLLCWPHKSGLPAWDVQALAAYRGSTVAHVGEWRGIHSRSGPREPSDGITTSPEFQAALEAAFECVVTVPLPRFTHVQDELTVWRRKGAAGA